MARIVVLGEALVDVFAESGVSLRDAQTLHPRPGGAPANVAVALARLGADVGFIGKVGTDEYGSFLIDLLRKEGVDTTHFMADPRAPTMLAIVASPSPTEQQFVLYNGANALLNSEALPRAYIATAACIHLRVGHVGRRQPRGSIPGRTLVQGGRPPRYLRREPAPFTLARSGDRPQVDRRRRGLCQRGQAERSRTRIPHCHQGPGAWKPPVGGTGRSALLCIVGSQWSLFRQWHVVRPRAGPGRRRD